MVYEAREAELRDQLTRIKSAEKKGKEEGIKEGIREGANEKAVRIAEKILKRGDSIEDIIELTELTKDTILQLKSKNQH